MKVCSTVLLMAAIFGGCGSGPDSTMAPVFGPVHGFGMGAAIEASKVANRHNSGQPIEPGRHGLAAAPCIGAGSHGIALVQLLSDLPSPRCLVVSGADRILVVNRSGAFHRRSTVTVTVRLGAYSARLVPQQAVVFAAPVGTYLATGVHDLRASSLPGPSVMVVRRRCAPRGRPIRLLKPIERCF